MDKRKSEKKINRRIFSGVIAAVWVGVAATVLFVIVLIRAGAVRHTSEEETEIKIAMKSTAMHVGELKKNLSGNQCVHVIYTLPEADKQAEEKETVTETKTADMYMEEAQAYIENEDYLSAIEDLAKGAEETGDIALAEKEKDLREHVVIRKEEHFENGRLCAEFEYDTAGNGIKSIGYDSTGNIWTWFETEYDNLGNSIKFVSRESNGDIGYQSEYEYVKGSNMVKSSHSYWYVEGAVWQEEIWEYDESGNHLKSTIYRGDGSIDELYEHEYDEVGNEIKTIVYHGEDCIEEWYEYKYDEAGNKIKEICYHGDGSIDYWKEFGYDDMENEIRYMLYDSDGSIDYGTESVYNDNGMVCKVLHYIEGGDISSWEEYEWDENGNPIKTTTYRDTGEIWHWWEYEYDGMGNETKAVNYDGYANVNLWDEYEYNENGDETKYIRHNDDGRINYVYVLEYDSLGNKIKITYFVGEDGYDFTILDELLIFQTVRVSGVTEYQYEYGYVE